MEILPVSAVIPTRHRHEVFGRTLDSLLRQQMLPAELIVVDASEDGLTRELLEGFQSRAGERCKVCWMRAEVMGAAAQRNQGVAAATQPVIWFFDDDILFEPECVARLWAALNSAADIGGVNAMITNQRYQKPGRVSRFMFQLMAGSRQNSYAGRVLGPAVNLLPEDRDDLPEVVPVEWLNLGCTLYRFWALPKPPFPSHFTGYSMMEDLTLSLLVGRKARLVNVRTARIFHDSQPGGHKNSQFELNRMQLVNRHFVMTEVLHRCDVVSCLRLIIWEFFGLISSALSFQGMCGLPQALCGRLAGGLDILKARFKTS